MFNLFAEAKLIQGNKIDREVIFTITLQRLRSTAAERHLILNTAERLCAYCLLQYDGWDWAHLNAAVAMAAAAHVIREGKAEIERNRGRGDLVKVHIKESHCSTKETHRDRPPQCQCNTHPCNPTYSFILSHTHSSN